MSEQGKATGRKKAQAFLSEDVLAPPPVTKQQVEALQAMAAGEANAGQQKMALDWIIYMACATHDEPFRPDAHSRMTDYACGRAGAGRNIIRALKLKPGQME